MILQRNAIVLVAIFKDSISGLIPVAVDKIKKMGESGFSHFGVHYENTPMQYTAIFHGCKNDKFRLKFVDFLHIFAQNIYCGDTLEPPH